MKMIRSDKLKINTSAEQKRVLGDTLSLCRQYVRDLMVLINARWQVFQHANGNDVVKMVETLIHPTSKRPKIKHPHFHKVWLCNDWMWKAFRLSGKSRYLGKGKAMSPLLTIKGKQWALSTPVKLDVPLKEQSRFQRVRTRR